MVDGNGTTRDETGARKARRDYRMTFALTAVVFLQLAIAPILPGYVHPDEFFQGGQELWFGCPPFVPWEFEAGHAVRSILPPMLLTWTPLRVYSMLVNVLFRKTAIADRSSSSVSSDSFLSGFEVLVIPRVVCILLNVGVVNTCIWSMSIRAGQSSSSTTSNSTDPPIAVWILVSTWTSWVFLSRPFSNSLETVFLALLLQLTLVRTGSGKTNQWWRDLAVGAVCAVGVFTRFTFVGFAIPPVMQYLLGVLKYSPNLVSFLQSTLVALVGFLLTSSVIVSSDVVYYRASWSDWTLYLTPLNGFLYNTNVNNLQIHGLHPRWTHAVVNMHILFGPLAVAFYVHLGRTLVGAFRETIRRQGKATEKVDQSASADSNLVRTTCLWTIVTGLCFLSLAPHQEPRFLLPILVPLCILSSDVIPRSNHALVVLWIIFNTVLLLLFGVLHQGGIVPILLGLFSKQQSSDQTTVLFFRTYMPPTFASRRRPSAIVSMCGTGDSDLPYCNVGSCPQHEFVDLQDSGIDSLVDSVATQLDCGLSSGTHPAFVHVVSPTLSEEGGVLLDSACFMGDPYTCRQLGTHFPNLSTEDFPPLYGSIIGMIRKMELGLYEVSCSK